MIKKRGKITEMNLVIDIIDPEHKGNNKLKITKAFKLIGSLLRKHIAKTIINIV